MNNFGPKLQKCSTHKIAFNVISKMLKQPNFLYSQPSTLPKDAPAKSYLSTTFDLSFMILSVASYPIVDFLRIFNHQNWDHNLIIDKHLGILFHKPMPICDIHGPTAFKFCIVK